MKRVAVCVVMLALTACGNDEGQQPPVEDMTHDATDEQPAYDASTHQDAPSQEDTGTGADASDAGTDASDTGTDTGGSDANDASVDAPDDAPVVPPVMCCSLGDAGDNFSLCSSPGVECRDGGAVCSVSTVFGSQAACPICSTPVGACAPDAGPTVACQTSGPEAIYVDSALSCVCAAGQMCGFTDLTRCTAECQ
jgi:hypothetical protein